MANQFSKAKIDFDVYERADPESQIDWGKEAKVISDSFANVAKTRGDKKAALEKAFQAQQDELNNLGEYDNTDVQSVVMNAGQDGANKLLDMKNMMKRGLVKPADVTMFQQKQLSGFTLLKKNLKNFDNTFKEYTTRLQTNMEGSDLPQGAPGEQWLAKQLEGFANMNNVSVQTDPETGNVSMLRLDKDGKPVPGSSATLNRLTLLMKQKINNFDPNKGLERAKAISGEVIQKQIDSKYGQNAKITTETRSRMETEYYKGTEGQKYLDAEAQSLLADPYDMQSFMLNSNLTTEDGTAFEPGDQKQFDDWNKEHKGNEKNNPYLVMAFGTDNVYNAEFTDDQKKIALDAMKTKITGTLDYSKEEDVKGLVQKPQETSYTGGQNKERDQNFSYVDQSAKIVSGTQQEFQEGVTTLSEAYNNSPKGQKNPLADNPVDRNSDPNFITVTYKSGEVKKVPRFQLDSKGDPVLDVKGNKIPRDQQQQNAEILSYMSPVEGSTDQIYKEYNKENPEGIKDYGGSDKEVNFLGVGDEVIDDTDLTNYPVLIDGKAGQLSDKFKTIGETTDGDDEKQLDLYKTEIDAILSKTFKNLNTPYNVIANDQFWRMGAINEIIIEIDGVKTPIEFNTKTESSKLLSELQEAINAAKTKIRDKRSTEKDTKEAEQNKKQEDKKKNKKKNLGDE